MAKENERIQDNSTEEESVELGATVETKARLGWREIFRQAFDKARRDNPPANRSGLGRDRSRSLFLLAGAAIAVLLLFLGVFSSPNRSRKPANARPVGTPDLGQRTTPGQQTSGQIGSVAPLLSAQTGHTDTPGNQGVTAEDVDKTARPVRLPEVAPNALSARPQAKPGPYALGQIDFSDVAARERTTEPASNAKSESDDLRKPSLVFVRNVQISPGGNGTRAASNEMEEPPTLELPSGTKLIARLESLATSAVKQPVVAAIEYNYERDGEIIIPAGAKALGNLQQVDRSGNVGIRFNSIQMPDGTTEKIAATAMSLTYGPLKGTVSGKKTGTNFLVRTFTGLGEAATYLVGSGGLSAPLSESAFLRDRIATNIGIAGDQELNNLTFNQNIVVTVPGNTRFYIVMEHGVTLPEAQAQPATTSQTNSASIPSMDELRQLLQLRQEMGAMYQQEGNTQSTAQQVPQQ
jgi:hypothetical protein